MMQSRYGLSSEFGTIVNAKGEVLTNFSLRVEKIFYSPKDRRKPELLRLRVHHLGKKQIVDLDLRDPHLLRQLRQKIPTCKVLKASASATIEAYMVELLETVRFRPPPLYFRQHGFHQLKDGRYVFVAGDEVLGLSTDDELAISQDIARAHLAYDKSLSCEEAVQKFSTVLKRDGDVVLPVWGFTLMSTMRSQLIGLSGSIFPSLVVTGNQGFGKTTVCQRFCLLYDDTVSGMRHRAQLDMRSTSASAINIIECFRDQVALIDDGAKSISSKEVRERKDLMAELLRFACNNTNRTKMKSSGKIADRLCTAGVAFNSEYALDNPSDIERTVIVNIRQEMQGGKETDRTYAATVFRYFILWLLPRLDEVISDLRAQLAAVHGSHQRLSKNRLMILWALDLFFRFVADSGAIPQTEVVNMRNHSKEIYDGLVNRQVEKIEKLSGPPNIGWHILAGIQDSIIEEVSEKVAKKKKNLPRYYFIRKKEDDVYCISTEILYNYCLTETPLRFSSTIAMNRELTLEGLVQPSQDGKAATVRIGGKRYLGIRHVDLVVAANEVYQ